MKTLALEFLSRVLPPGPGYYCFSQKVNITKTTTDAAGVAQQKEIPLWRDRPLTELEGLIDLSLEASAEGYDTYYAASIFAQPSILLAGKLKFRVATNAVRQRSLWLDIDAKGRAGEYNSLADAQAGLQEFLSVSGVPDPLVVCSGRGLHVYWPFAEVTPAEQWKALALSLKQVCQKFELKVDHHRTYDLASVLRIPGTKNYGKDGQVRDVSILSWGEVTTADSLRNKFQTALGSSSVVVKTESISPVSRLPKATTGIDGLVSSFKTLDDPTGAVRGCRHINGAGLANYYSWYNAIKVLTKCKKGREIAHNISQYDAERYDPNVVDEKFNQAEASSAGPPRCETFELAESGIDEGWCRACQYHKKHSTPLQCPLPVELKTDEPEQEPDSEGSGEIDQKLANAKMPEPFDNGRFRVVPGTGIMWCKKALDDGELEAQDILLAEVELYLSCGTNEPDEAGEPHKSFVFKCRHKGKRLPDIKYSGSRDMRNFKEWLFNRDLTPPDGVPIKRMEDFMLAYIHKMRHKVPNHLLYNSLGWRTINNERTGKGEQGFILGERRFLPGRMDIVSLSSRCLKAVEKEFTSAGSLDVWKEAADMYRVLDQKQGQLFICAGFAAPFMSMHETETNSMFSLYDPYGGKGKSWVLKMINSIWGHPTSMFGQPGDTFNARYKKLAVRRHLPMCIDEVTTAKDDALVQMLYTIGGGQEKDRLNGAGADFIPGGTWATTTFFTANQSLYEKMENYSAQNLATKRRVIEFRCDFKDYTNTSFGPYIKKMISVIGSNYGLAGAYMIEHYLSDPKAQVSIPADLAELEAEFNEAGNESFWAAGMSAAIVAGRYAKSLGLINYDIDALIDWAKAEMVGIRQEIKTDNQDPASILGAFLNEHYDSTLIVLSERRPIDMRDPGNLDGTDSYIVKAPHNKLLIRYEREEHVAKISYPIFKAWCQERRLSTKTILTEAYGKRIVTSIDPAPCGLGNGVSALPRVRVQAITIKASMLDVVDYERY